MMSWKQLLVAAIVVLAPLAECQPPPPFRCCLPDQFSAVMSDLTTINGNTIAVKHLQYDFKNKKQVMLSETVKLQPFKGSNVTDRTVIDFVQQKLYYIPKNDPGTCYKKEYPVGFVQCVPENATYLGDSYLGPMPMAGGLSYGGWRFPLPNSNLVVTLAATRNECVPLVEGISTLGQPENDKTYLFSQYQPSLVDSDMFKLPASCLQ